MAGYSQTPLGKKLGIKPGARVRLIRAPDSVVRELSPLPDGARLLARLARPVDVAVLFARSGAELGRNFERVAGALADDGGLWVAWPKKSSALATDLSFDRVRRHGLDAGLVDNKVCAVDEDWSGLRFVVRVKDRRRGAGRGR